MWRRPWRPQFRHPCARTSPSTAGRRVGSLTPFARRAAVLQESGAERTRAREPAGRHGLLRGRRQGRSRRGPRRHRPALDGDHAARDRRPLDGVGLPERRDAHGVHAHRRHLQQERARAPPQRPSRPGCANLQGESQANLPFASFLPPTSTIPFTSATLRSPSLPSLSDACLAHRTPRTAHSHTACRMPHAAPHPADPFTRRPGRFTLPTCTSRSA